MREKIENERFYQIMKSAVRGSKALPIDSKTVKAMEYELTKQGVTGSEAFYSSLGFAIGEYEEKTKVDISLLEQRKTLRTMINTPKTFAKQMTSNLNILSQTMLPLNLHKLLEQVVQFNQMVEGRIKEIDNIIPPLKGRPTNRNKQELFIRVADSLEEYLGKVPTKAIGGLYENIMSAIWEKLTHFGNDQESSTHKTAIKAINQKQNKENMWRLIDFKASKLPADTFHHLSSPIELKNQ